MTEQPPVTGPIPIYVNRLPGGAQLDLGALTALVVSDVLDALLDPADSGLWDLLAEVANPVATPEGTESLDREELERRLGERASSKIPLYGEGAKRLAATLLKASGHHVPGQRGRAA